MGAVLQEGSIRAFAVKTTDTNQTTAYTCPTHIAVAIVVWVNVADDAGAARTMTLEWTDSSATTTYALEFTKAIATAAGYNAEMYLTLEPGDSLSITSSAAGLHLTGAVLEVAKRP